MEYQAVSSSATLRQYTSLSNPTGSDITVTVDFATNFGSDGNTQIIDSSSGDLTFGTDDRWVVTDDFSVTGGDPANTTVFYGPDSPAVVPTSVSETVFNCAGTQGLLATYSVTVPAGETRALMFFHQMNDTSTNGVAAAALFDVTPLPGDDLATGLTAAQLGQVVNWASNQPPVADAGPDQTVECTGIPLAGCADVTLDGTGSSDPDGDALTYTWQHLDEPGVLGGPMPNVTLKLGTHTFELTVDDGNGGTATDTVTITVEDATGPVATAALVPVDVKKKSGTFEVHFSCADACEGDLGVATATLNGVAVTNGQLVALRVKSAKSAKSAKSVKSAKSAKSAKADPIVKIEGPAFELTVECVDEAGNSTSATATPAFATSLKSIKSDKSAKSAKSVK